MGFSEETWSAFIAVFSDVKFQELHHCQTRRHRPDKFFNDVKQVNIHNDVAFVALDDTISQLQNLLKVQLGDNVVKDDELSSGFSSLHLISWHAVKIYDNVLPNTTLVIAWDYVLHFEGQLHDHADVVCCFLKQE
ncbi:hypothetical protein QOT17_024038 [Balamuthia mandrillaris]